MTTTLIVTDPHHAAHIIGAGWHLDAYRQSSAGNKARIDLIGPTGATIELLRDDDGDLVERVFTVLALLIGRDGLTIDVTELIERNRNNIDGEARLLAAILAHNEDDPIAYAGDADSLLRLYCRANPGDELSLGDLIDDLDEVLRHTPYARDNLGGRAATFGRIRARLLNLNDLLRKAQP